MKGAEMVLSEASGSIIVPPLTISLSKPFLSFFLSLSPSFSPRVNTDLVAG